MPRSIGKVFWAGAIAQMGDRDLTTVVGTLGELSQKQFVRVARRSSIEGETEYAFWHITRARRRIRTAAAILPSFASHRRSRVARIQSG